MATPNYSYEKRQRELAKKRKNEEKLQKKKQGHGAVDNGVRSEANPETPAAPANTPPATA